MASPRALIEMVVEGAAESRRRLGGVGDEMRRLNSQSLQNLSSQVDGLNDRISGLQSAFGNIAGFAIAGVSLATLGTQVGGVLDSMAELDDLSQKVGTSVESLSRIQKVAKAFGVEFGASVDPAVVKFARGLTTVDDKSSKTAKALAAIGVAAKDSAGKLRDPGAVMIDVAKSLQRYEDGAGKAAVVTDLFGKSGADLLPFFNDLAENVDNFSGVTDEAVAQATALQDRFTKLGERTDAFFTDVTVAALPALGSLADGFSDVLKAENNLVNSEKIGKWTDNLAVGLARVADVAALLPRMFSAVSNSFEVVGADISVFQKMTEVANPLNAAKMVLDGRSPTAELKAVIAERNKILDSANAEYDELWNKPANLFEQAVLKRIAQRSSDNKPSGQKQEGGDETLNYGGSGDPTKDSTKAATKALNEYEALLDRISGKSVGIDADFYANLGKLYDGYTAGKQSLEEYVDTVGTYISQQQFVKQAEDERTKSLELYQKALDAASSGSMKAATELQTQRDENEQIGLETAALGELKAARLEDLALRAEANAWMADGLDITGALAEEYRKEAAALRDRAQAVREGVAMQANADAVKKAGEDLDKFLDPTKAQTFGDALKGAFGAAGDSMTQLISGLDAYGIRQAEIDKARKDAATKYASDSKGFAEATAAISAKEVKSRMAGYGDMASAAKGFFKESSTGYQVLEGAERAFRAFELASQMESLYTHLFVTTAKATGTTAGQGVETAAVVAGEAARNTAKVPGVFMSFMSAMGPWGMAAAGVAIAAVLGGAFGGGSSVSLSQQRQEKQGTGTVFGDSTAKSESILNAIEAVEDNTYQGLAISQGMLTALTDIRSNIGSFAAQVLRNDSITGTAAKFEGLDGSESNFLSKLGNSIFGGKKTLEDTGFTMKALSFADVLNGGVDANSYAEIKKSGGWFSSSKTSTQLEGLGPDGNRQIANAIMSLGDMIKTAGGVFGLEGDAFIEQLNSYKIDLGKISFKGMKPDEIEAELQAVFSALGDDMAAFAVAGLDPFQQVGEGYLETLTRVAAGYETVNVVMDSLGMGFDSVGLASVGARQRLIDLAGGLDEFTAGAEQFLDDFFTDQERANSLRARITPTLDQFGIETGVEDSLQQFRSVVTGLDLTTEAGARAYATLMQIAPAFKQIADVDAKIFEERSDLQKELDQLTLSETVLLAQQRAALDESNRALFDQVQAIKAQTSAAQAAKDVADSLMGGVDSAFSVLQRVVDREKAALQSQIANHTEAANKIRAVSNSLRSTINSMRGPGAEVMERARAQSDLRSFLAVARVGGVLPDSEKLQAVLSTLTQDASEQFASFADYQADFYRTRNDMASLASISDAALSVEERTLKTLEGQMASYDEMLEREQEQIDQLKGISTIGLSIRDAILALQSAIAGAKANPLNAAASSINDAYKTALGRAPDAAGLEYWKGSAAAGNSISDIIDAISNSPEAKIKALYQSTFGRTVDAAGLQYWMDRASSGVSYDTIEQGLKESNEYKKKQGIPGYATGGDHSGGWRIVGENGPELEATGPARIFNANQTRDLMARLGSPVDNSSALAAEVRQLRAQSDTQQAALDRALVAIAKYSKQTADVLDRWENIGSPKERVK